MFNSLRRIVIGGVRGVRPVSSLKNTVKATLIPKKKDAILLPQTGTYMQNTEQFNVTKSVPVKNISFSKAPLFLHKKKEESFKQESISANQVTKLNYNKGLASKARQSQIDNKEVRETSTNIRFLNAKRGSLIGL